MNGPCGPMPPSLSHAWAAQIQKGYPRQAFANALVGVAEPYSVPVISPAWQSLVKTEESSQRAVLDIPKALDHRYFVRDPQSCFRESLFERDGDDEDNDEEEEEEE